MKDKEYLVSNGIDVDKSLELFGDMEMYDDTLNEFLNAVDAKIANLTSTKESGNAHDYAIYAHSLKSDARYLGFTKLAEIAYNHEMAGKENNINFIYEDFDNLMKEAKRIIGIVKEYVGAEITDVEEEEEPVVTDKKSILIVDDSNLVTSFIKKIFDNKYECLIAEDGADALKIVGEDVHHNIVGMFLDLNMPNVDGFQVLEYFSKTNLFDRIPVTIITGVDNKDEIEKASQYPVIDVLEKPFNEKNVKMSIEKMER